MKRHGNLWKQVIDFENLLLASRKAQKGKRFRENVLQFNFNLERNLIELQSELLSLTYQPGAYATFEIREPKHRLISAAPYRDRIVHHALCNIISPIFDRSFLSCSYANRTGYGTHLALKKFIQLARSHQYILQCDIQKYFPSIDHEILKMMIRNKIKCRDTNWLINSIIDASNPQFLVHDYFEGDHLLTPLQRRKGLPIGNLTSQLFANLYLNKFDYFVLENLKISNYIRYSDDFALFSNSHSVLEQARREIESFLEKIRLKIHPIKSQLFATRQGANFLGFRILPNQIRVRSHSLKRGRRRLRQLLQQLDQGIVTQNDLCSSLQSWFAHLDHADSWHLRQNILKENFQNYPLIL